VCFNIQRQGENKGKRKRRDSSIHGSPRRTDWSGAMQ
jgi:hypothetical protein